MDDLKLFVKNNCTLRLLLDTVKIFCTDILGWILYLYTRMDFGISKCAKLSAKL